MEPISFEITEARFSPFLLDSIVSLLVFDSDFLKRSMCLFKPQVFEGERRTISELSYDYFRKYNSAPGEYIVDILENHLSRRQSQRELLYKYLDKIASMDVNKNYVLESFGSFVKDKMCADAINRASDFQKRGRSVEAYNEIVSTFKEANLVTGQTVFDLLDPFNLDSVLSGVSSEPNAKTLIEPYDKATGGVMRNEMILIFGDTNISKTYSVVGLGTNFAFQGKNVLEIHLETSEDEIKVRHAKALTGMQIRFRNMKDNEEKDSVKSIIRERLLKKIEFGQRRGGHLWLKYPTGFTMANLRALVDDIEFQEGVPVDIVLLDSPKQMKTDSKYRDFYVDEMLLYQDLFQFKKERNITLICTAWSRDRGEHGSGLTKGNQVGGSIDKLRIVDTVWTLTQNEQENRQNILWMFVGKARMSQKFMVYEIQQDLDRGQWCVAAKAVHAGSKAAEEARKLGLAYCKDNNKKEKEK